MVSFFMRAEDFRVLPGRDPDEPLEEAGKMALIRKARLERHLDHRHVPFKQFPCLGDADGFEIPVRRDAFLFGE